MDTAHLLNGIGHQRIVKIYEGHPRRSIAVPTKINISTMVRQLLYSFPSRSRSLNGSAVNGVSALFT